MDRIEKGISSFVMGRFRLPSFVGITDQNASQALTHRPPRDDPSEATAKERVNLVG
jgi:hypothetical protein